MSGFNIGTLFAQIALDTTRLVSGQREVEVRMSALNSTMLRGAAAISAAISAAVSIHTIREAIGELDKFELSVIRVASMITGMQGPKDVTENYKKNYEYAERIAEKLEEWDAKSAANGETLMIMNEELVKGKVLINANNKAQEEGFIALSNALATYTAGQNASIQAHQEIRGLIQGQVNVHTQLGMQIDSLIRNEGKYKGGLKEATAEWLKQGTFLENIRKYLVGFVASAQDMEKTWTAVSSTLQTKVAAVMRTSVKPLWEDIREVINQISSGLEEHVNIIASSVYKAWMAVKGVLESIEILFNRQTGALGGITMLAIAVANTVGMIAKGWTMIAAVVLPTVVEKIGSILKLTGNAAAGIWALVTGQFKDAKYWADSAKKNLSDLLSMSKFDERYAKYAKQFTKSHVVPETPKLGKTPDTSTGSDAYENAKAYEQSVKAYEDALEARTLASLKTQNEARMQADQEYYDWGAISQEEFLKRKLALTQANLLAEVEYRKNQLNRALEVESKMEAEYAAGKATGAEVNRVYTERVKAAQAVDEAQNELRKTTQQLRVENDTLIFSAVAGWKDLQAQVMEANGSYVQATKLRKQMAEADPKYWQLVQAAMAGNEDAVKAFWAVEEMASKKVTDSVTKETQERISLSQMELELQQAKINTQEEFFKITTGEAAQQSIAILEKQLANHQAIYDTIQGNSAVEQTLRLQELSAIQQINAELLKKKKILQEQYGTAAAGLKEGIDQYRRTLPSTFQSMADIGKSTCDILESSFSTLFDDVLHGKVTSFSKFFQDVSNQMLSMISKMLAKWAMAALIGEQGGAGGLLSGLGGLFSGLFGGGSGMDLRNFGTDLGGGGILARAKGGAFQYGVPLQINGFANGGLITKPTFFSYSQGIGMAGEAGTEAIMPLSRTSSGHLGVRAIGKSENQGNSLMISVPINVEAGNKLASELRTEVEAVVRNVIKRNS